MTPLERQRLVFEMIALCDRIGTIPRNPEEWTHEDLLKKLGVPFDPVDVDPDTSTDALLRHHPEAADWGPDELRAWIASFEARHELQQDHVQAHLRDLARQLEIFKLLGVPDDMCWRDWLKKNK